MDRQWSVRVTKPGQTVNGLSGFGFGPSMDRPGLVPAVQKGLEPATVSDWLC